MTSELDIVISTEAEGWDEAACEVQITAAALATLAVVTLPPCARAEIGVTLSDDEQVRVLNRDHRGQDKSTNVLSFPIDEPPQAPPPGAPLLLGDIVLARETITAEALDQGKNFAAHLSHLVVHGVLHLVGYDHMIDQDAERMEQLEREILARLGVADPYAPTQSPADTAAFDHHTSGP
ncbi:Endoribonuclease YbeY [uncultured Gammaproteobacteria bacterium]